ncbi:MAG TPA: caspase family protein, partial [Thermoanaerobaculia bacterium]
MSNRVRGLWLAAGVMLLACDLPVAETTVATETSVATKTSSPRAPRPQTTPGRRRAVLVCIDDYSASGLGRPRAGVPSRGWQSLKGAVNDVEAMREMIRERHGFADADILVLKNQQATRNAILQALEQHLERPAQKGDVVFFYYSGHGSQVPNSRSTEKDRLDESLVPADSRIGAEDIRDKELRQRFNRILDRGARLTVILDSCHSGSGTRGLIVEGGARAVQRSTRGV